MRLRLLLHCSVLVLSGLFPTGAFAAIQIQLDVSSHSVLLPETKGKAPADTQTKLTAVLADDYLSVEGTDGRTIFDLSNRRQYQLDPAHKTYVNYSLYEIPGFRVMEMSSRDRMRRALAAAKLTPPQSLLDDENSLSLHEGADVTLDDQSTDNERALAGGGHELAHWSRQGTSVTAAQATQFVRLLRYQVGGHPQVLASLLAENRIPARITIDLHDGGILRQETFSVTAVQKSDADMFSLAGYSQHQAAAGDNKVDAMLDRAAALPGDALQNALTANKQGMDAAFASGQVLDAFLGYIEHSLMSGQALMSLDDAQKAQVQADAATHTLLDALAAKTPEDMRRAVQVLVDLRPHALHKAYVLMLFEANDRLALHDAAAAEDLFLNVLQCNPELTGAYKDFGDLEIQQFDMPRAWRSWDAGRRLAPDFGNFIPVNKFEADLLQHHPEYF